MLDTIIRYLQSTSAPFRFASYPNPGTSPRSVHPIPPHGMLVDSHVVRVGGSLVLVCFPANQQLDLASLGNELGSPALEPSNDELPHDLRAIEGGHIPPLGHLFGLPLIVDAKVSQCSVLVFQAVGESDFFELPYDDFARQEQPRVASFAIAGELTS